uniref:Uncharacterized protein n=1 Tax=Kuenenia stuttgartiensis TaxID=174633 RepID=Q1Q5C3_KUEST|nr:unknown protein [Candidatus Kuenenia stuttgartiensis]
MIHSRPGYTSISQYGGFKYFSDIPPRRAACPVDGIHVERVPWSEGKEQMTTTYKEFLSR